MAAREPGSFAFDAHGRLSVHIHLARKHDAFWASCDENGNIASHVGSLLEFRKEGYIHTAHGANDECGDCYERSGWACGRHATFYHANDPGHISQTTK